MAYRGASAAWPEHSVGAYRAAIEQGAQWIECDLVLTKDWIPVCRHEPNLINTTDAASKFPDHITTHVIDGTPVSGIFTVDLTFDELKTLRSCHPYPLTEEQGYVVPEGASEEDLQVASLEDLIGLLQAQPQAVGMCVHVQHPTWHTQLMRSRGEGRLSYEDVLLEMLQRYGYTHPLHSAGWGLRPVWVMSFELRWMEALAQRTRTALAPVLSSKDPDTGATFEEMTSEESLARIAQYAQGVALAKRNVLQRNPGAVVGTSAYRHSGLIRRLHAHKLMVFASVFRNHPAFLLPGLAEAGAGVEAEYDLLLDVDSQQGGGEALLDGLFTDEPAALRSRLQAYASAGWQAAERKLAMQQQWAQQQAGQVCGQQQGQQQ